MDRTLTLIFDNSITTQDIITKISALLLGQVSGLTSIPEVERSIDLCMSMVYSYPSYFISAIVKTFCMYGKSMIKDVDEKIEIKSNCLSSNKDP